MGMSAADRCEQEDERPTPEGLYRTWGRHVLLMLRRFGVREADCEDAAHEVFLIAIRRLPEYEPRGRVIGWLGAIAARVALKCRGKYQREQIMDDDSDSVEPPDAPDSELVAAVRDLVLRLVETLEPDRRTVYVLHELEGVPIPDVARELKIAEGTAWNRLRLAKQDMQAAYKRFLARKGAAVVPLFGLEQLIDMERRTPPPPMPPGMEERIWARLQRAPEFPRDVSSGDAGVPSPSVSPALTGGGLLVGGVLLALGIVIGAVWDPLHRAPPPSAPPVPVAVAMPSSTASAAPSVTPSAMASASAAPSVTPSATASAVPSAMAQDIAAERAVLRVAADALAKNDTAAALAAVEEHADRFRRGQLAEERETIAIRALHRAGGTAEARARLARFARAYPHSKRLDSLRDAIGGD